MSGAPLIELSVVAELRQAEIEHLRIPIAANHHVLGFQVAMDDAGGVRCRQRAADLQRDVERFRHVDPARGKPFAQRLPVDVFRGDEMHVSLAADVVNGQDVRMVQR